MAARKPRKASPAKPAPSAVAVERWQVSMGDETFEVSGAGYPGAVAALEALLRERGIARRSASFDRLGPA